MKKTDRQRGLWIRQDSQEILSPVSEGKYLILELAARLPYTGWTGGIGGA